MINFYVQSPIRYEHKSALPHLNFRCVIGAARNMQTFVYDAGNADVSEIKYIARSTIAMPFI